MPPRFPIGAEFLYNNGNSDAGDEFSNPTHRAAMRGYIAFLRLRAADGSLIAQPFNPILLRLGQKPFSDLLSRILEGEVSDEPS